jgi:hypothetical protein
LEIAPAENILAEAECFHGIFGNIYEGLAFLSRLFLLGEQLD